LSVLSQKQKERKLREEEKRGEGKGSETLYREANMRKSPECRNAGMQECISVPTARGNIPQ